MGAAVAHEIVEVTATRIKAGTRTPLIFEDYAITTHDVDDADWWGQLKFFDAATGKPIPQELILDGQPEGAVCHRPTVCALHEDWMGLSFRCAGQSNDPNTSGGIDHLVNSDGPQAAFEGWEEELFALAERFLSKPRYPFTRLPFGGSGTVRFLTLWEYTSTQGREGEWDCYYRLRGALDPAKLALALVDTPTEERGKDEHR